jgi:hypothetical protein
MGAMPTLAWACRGFLFELKSMDRTDLKSMRKTDLKSVLQHAHASVGMAPGLLTVN